MHCSIERPSFQAQVYQTAQTISHTISDTTERVLNAAKTALINAPEINAKTCILSGGVVVALTLLNPPAGITLFVGSCLVCVGLTILYLQAQAKLEEQELAFAYPSAPPILDQDIYNPNSDTY